MSSSNWRQYSVEEAYEAIGGVITQQSGGFYLVRFFNPHWTDDELDKIINAAESGILSYEDFADKPLFHSYSPSKKHGFYAQLKHLGKGTPYIHQMSAIINYNQLHNECKTGTDIISQFPDPDTVEASHIYQGYATSSRDYNPRNVTFEDGAVNRSRYFCTLHMAGQLRHYYGFSKATSEFATIPLTATQPDPVNDQEATDIEDLGGSQAAAGMYFTSQDIINESDRLYNAASEAVCSSCVNVHNPPCRFWDYPAWGEVPVVSALIIDTRKLNSPDKRSEAISTLQAKIDDVLKQLANTVFTPPPKKHKRSSAQAGPSSFPA